MCASKTRYPYAVSDHDLENANLVVPLEEPSTCFSYQFRQPEAQERWKLRWLRQPEAQGAVFFLTLLEETIPKPTKTGLEHGAVRQKCMSEATPKARPRK